MPDLVWDDVAKLFVPDGMLLDAYVFDTTMADWQAFIDLVRSRGWWFAYGEVGGWKRMPDRVETVHERRFDLGSSLYIKPVPEVTVRVYFFEVEEIEVVLAPPGGAGPGPAGRGVRLPPGGQPPTGQADGAHPGERAKVPPDRVRLRDRQRGADVAP